MDNRLRLKLQLILWEGLYWLHQRKVIDFDTYMRWREELDVRKWDDEKLDLFLKGIAELVKRIKTEEKAKKEVKV